MNELRLNYTRNVSVTGKISAGLGKVSTWGFVEGGATGIIPQTPALEAVPPISLSSGPSWANYNQDGSFDNSYQLADSFSKVIRRHTLKFGGDFRKLQLNSRSIAHNSGKFNFNGVETGSDFADYLLGAPSYFEQYSPSDLDDRSTYGALFIQDSMKVRPNLTVNAGLRWEDGTPWADQKGRVETFIPGEESTLYPDAPKGWVFPGDPASHRECGRTKRPISRLGWVLLTLQGSPKDPWVSCLAVPVKPVFELPSASITQHWRKSRTCGSRQPAVCPGLGRQQQLP